MIKYRLVPDYGGAYRVGDDGSVWTRKYQGYHSRNGKLSSTWRKLTPRINEDGYVKIGFFDGHRNVRHFSVHGLVLSLFVEPRPQNMECRHLNGIPSDNRLENLKWGTKKEQWQDRRRHGTWQQARGEKHGCAKLTSDQAREIRNRVVLHRKIRFQAGFRKAADGFIKSIAKEFGIAVVTVHAVVSGKRNWAWLIE